MGVHLHGEGGKRVSVGRDVAPDLCGGLGG